LSAKTHIDAALQARARVTSSRRSVNNVPQLGTFGRANVAEVRHKLGKIAKSLSCNDIKFNIIHIMTLSPAPTPNLRRDPRLTPPLSDLGRVQMPMSPSRTPRKIFHKFTPQEC
jgi:hypothetical protein